MGIGNKIRLRRQEEKNQQYGVFPLCPASECVVLHLGPKTQFFWPTDTLLQLQEQQHAGSHHSFPFPLRGIFNGEGGGRRGEGMGLCTAVPMELRLNREPGGEQLYTRRKPSKKEGDPLINVMPAARQSALASNTTASWQLHWHQLQQGSFTNYVDKHSGWVGQERQ